MDVAGYLRVSTNGQADHGLGLDVQAAEVRAWCERQGHTLVAMHTDEGVSGSNGLEARAGLADALGDVQEGRAQAVVVYRLDRLARDLIVQETLLAEVRRMGAQVFSTSAAEAEYLADDPDDPSRKLIRQVLGAVAEYDRAMITLRLKRGRRAKARAGGYTGGQRLHRRYGYTLVDGQYVPEPSEQKVIGRIHQLRTKGRSMRAIADDLNARGTAPPAGERWHVSAIQRILGREMATK